MITPQQPPGELRTRIGKLFTALKEAVVNAFWFVASGVVGILLVVVFAGPAYWVVNVTLRYVLDVPGAQHLFLPALVGLFFGVYLLPFSILAGTFSPRLSARIAKLSPVLIAEAKPGKLVAIAAHVASGCPTKPLKNESQSGEERVGYPMVLKDAAGDSVIVEHYDGLEEPIDPSFEGFRALHVGDPVIAVGEVKRAGAVSYRTSAETARLVRGKSAYFRVSEGDLGGLVQEIKTGELSRVWGFVAIGLLVMGGLSLYAGYSLKREWLNMGYLRSRAHAANGFAQHRVIGGNDSNVCQ